MQTIVLTTSILLNSNVFAQSDSLLTSGSYFDLSSHVVSTSFFHWYGANTGQVSGPWMPIEGRENWTGDVEFFKTMIKQAMAANIDVFYVHLIPHMEQQRINLFQALYELRELGWDVPKVCPFFDSLITCDLIGHNIDVGTEAGKNELVSHYIRFYEQYYSKNKDEYADDYIYTIDEKVVLNTWHVHLNIENYQLLFRGDVSSRLSASLARDHSIFYNGIYMITTADSPTFTFADEKVHQFEVHEYYIEKSHNSIVSAQIKPGYWDQNVRNPGYILKRNGGSKYTNAWNQVDASVNRIYIESFNEYDEGSGIYAAKTDTIYRVGGNTSTDTWSALNDPYDYIKTTAIGAANFNDNSQLDSKIVWHNIPEEMFPGDTINAKVVVRNYGNEKWSNAKNFKFGQQEGDVKFGLGSYLINDTQNEIPIYGGIFRGRTVIFNMEIISPETEGVYPVKWSMLQDEAEWFGELLEMNITVSLTINIEQNTIENKFNIYPNPIFSNGSIQIDGDFIKGDRISLININGNKIFEQEILNSEKNLIMNLQRYNIVEGVYFIQVITNNSTQTSKILLKR